jgi:uncharacterized damage-inducible protein DinB
MNEALQEIFNRDLEKLKTEIASYLPEDDLWKVTEGIKNSAGNLCLHLIGNLNHFIGKELGGFDYTRNRELEFSLKNVPAAELLVQVEETKNVVDSSLSKLSAAALEKVYPLNVFEKEMKTGFFLLHLATHLSYHLGQINYHRRMLQ